MTTLKRSMLIVAAWLMAACVPAESQTQPPPLVLRDARVVDVATGRVLDGQTVVLQGDRIEAVGATADVPVPAGARVVDLEGAFLLPGLADMHVHTGPERSWRDLTEDA